MTGRILAALAPLLLVATAAGRPPPDLKTIPVDQPVEAVWRCQGEYGPALAGRDAPGLQMLAPPRTLAVGADFGLTVLAGAEAAAVSRALFIVSPDGHEILARHGFTAPARAAHNPRE